MFHRNSIETCVFHLWLCVPAGDGGENVRLIISENAVETLARDQPIAKHKNHEQPIPILYEESMGIIFMLENDYKVSPDSEHHHKASGKIRI